MEFISNGSNLIDDLTFFVFWTWNGQNQEVNVNANKTICLMELNGLISKFQIMT